MQTEHPFSSDVFEPDPVLDRAVAELRDTAIPDGPSAQLMAGTRQLIRREAASGAGWSLVLRPAFLRIAAVVGLLLGASVVYWSMTHHGGPSVAKSGHETALPAPVDLHAAPAPTRTDPPIAPIIKHNDPAPVMAASLPEGTIAGRVIFAGVAPPPTALPGVNLMPDCFKLHGGPIYDESLAVNSNGGLANVVVSVSSGLSGWLREEFPPPVETAVLDQNGCVFVPHVVAVMVGQPLLIKNSDPVMHDVHVMAVNNPAANLGQPTVGERATGPFESPEVFRVKCDVHPWMQAWVRVLDNPFFAVTDRNGRFTLHGLPPGTYTLKAWHEQLGVREMQITIGPRQGAQADFSFVGVPQQSMPPH